MFRFLDNDNAFEARIMVKVTEITTKSTSIFFILCCARRRRRRVRKVLSLPTAAVCTLSSTLEVIAQPALDWKRENNGVNRLFL